MFDKEYSFTGKHANMVNDLTKPFDNKNNKLFKTNWEVYLIAPIIGFLYGKKAESDKNKDIDPTKIFPDQLIKYADDFWFNYATIMLLDTKNEPDLEKRIEKAFRRIKNESDEELYESYVRGGIEILYDKLMNGVTNPDDYPNRLYDFLEDFDERYNQDIDMDSILELCKKAKS